MTRRALSICLALAVSGAVDRRPPAPRMTRGSRRGSCRGSASAGITTWRSTTSPRSATTRTRRPSCGRGSTSRRGAPWSTPRRTAPTRRSAVGAARPGPRPTRSLHQGQPRPAPRRSRRWSTSPTCSTNGAATPRSRPTRRRPPPRRTPSSSRPAATSTAPARPTTRPFDRLDAKFKNYPTFLEDNDPLKAERERVQRR